MPKLELLRRMFDELAEPVVFFCDDVIEYENPAAARLLRGGESETLRAAVKGREERCVTLGGRACRVRTAPWEGGMLAVLRPELSRAGLERRLPLLTEDLRRQVNNLMAAVHLVSPALREAGDGRYGDYLAIMNQSFYRLMRLIQCADLAEDLAEDRLQPREQALDLAGFCAELMRQVEPLAERMGVALSWDRGVDTLLTTGDEGLLRQMLLELLSNALRGAGAGGRAGLRLAAGGGKALITVWNSGAEIDLSALEETEYAPRPEGGLRLGLAAARQIAALHGGTIMLEPRAGDGTRAVVSLPVRPPQPGMVRTPEGEHTGGFSPVLVALAGVLPYEAFREEDLE